MICMQPVQLSMLSWSFNLPELHTILFQSHWCVRLVTWWLRVQYQVNFLTVLFSPVPPAETVKKVVSGVEKKFVLVLVRESQETCMSLIAMISPLLLK